MSLLSGCRPGMSLELKAKYSANSTGQWKTAPRNYSKHFPTQSWYFKTFVYLRGEKAYK
jgi:hypothetical protein